VNGGADLVVGTAGHIDHGKTSLVRTLTGVDLDALPEEKRRGITIALGFTALELPDGRRAAVIDVPGHERLVRTMVAGATGVDAVLLCVSAVDGVMPQTREHLAILRLLGVQEGAVVLTMADLVDPEMLELAREDVADGVHGTFLEGRPIVPFSAVSGQGREELLELVAGFQRAERDVEGPFRLPVDRTFVRSGFGTVVTGTVASGRLEDGSSVRLLPGDGTARVRGLQAHGETVGAVQAGWRAAVNLAGVDRDAVSRGVVVTTADLPCPHMIDVRYRHLASAPPLEDRAVVQVLHGTEEVTGRLHLAEDLEELTPGRVTFAQLRLDHPLPCLPGDRFIIRRPSPADTVGGGEILDPWTRKMRHKERAAHGRQLARLHGGDLQVYLERAGDVGLTPAEWALRGRGAPGVQVGDRVLAPPIVGRLEGALVESLAAFHATRALALGAQRRELRRGRVGHLPDRLFDALVERLAAVGLVTLEGPLVRLKGFAVELTPPQAALQVAIRETIAAAGLSGVTVKALHEAHPDPETAALVHLLESAGEVEQVPSVGWMMAAVLDGLRASLRAFFADHDTMATGDFKELSGQSRRAAIPLLELCDKRRWTRRLGDARLRGDAL
jgi:selenocysteine-specific elongation factor